MLSADKAGEQPAKKKKPQLPEVLYCNIDALGPNQELTFEMLRVQHIRQQMQAISLSQVDMEREDHLDDTLNFGNAVAVNVDELTHIEAFKDPTQDLRAALSSNPENIPNPENILNPENLTENIAFRNDFRQFDGLRVLDQIKVGGFLVWGELRLHVKRILQETPIMTAVVSDLSKVELEEASLFVLRAGVGLSPQHLRFDDCVVQLWSLPSTAIFVEDVLPRITEELLAIFILFLLLQCSKPPLGLILRVDLESFEDLSGTFRADGSMGWSKIWIESVIPGGSIEPNALLQWMQSRMTLKPTWTTFKEVSRCPSNLRQLLSSPDPSRFPRNLKSLLLGLCLSFS